MKINTSGLTLVSQGTLQERSRILTTKLMANNPATTTKLPIIDLKKNR